MSELISGKEALIALANGEEIQCQIKGNNSWSKIHKNTPIDYLLSGKNKTGFGFEFRLKPKTITLNGIEVPACGENYEYGNAMYILNSLEPEEYSLVVLDKVDEIPLYWWKTEDEIKQVVAVLRIIFSNK